MSRPIRVAVANTPRLLRELMIETMMDQLDIKIVAEIQTESEIARVIEQTAPEFLIIVLDPPDPCPSVCVSLLQRYPKLKILALATERNCGFLYSASVNIGAISLEVSESGILEALRSESRVEVGEQR
jgi:DNA-binding NarL/FixJ family response regulator